MAVRKRAESLLQTFQIEAVPRYQNEARPPKTSRMSLEMMIMIALARFRIAVPVHRPNILVGVAW